jgi:hypothetical protein
MTPTVFGPALVISPTPTIHDDIILVKSWLCLLLRRLLAFLLNKEKEKEKGMIQAKYT